MTTKIKVLIFEDRAEDALILKETLSQQHIEIAGIASSYTEGIALLNSVDFDIALLDIFVKGKPEGIQFANEIEDDKPFIFITSSIEATVFEEAKDTNPHNYLIKPYNPLELLFAIELAIEKSAAQEGAFSQKIPVHHNDAIFIKKNKALVKIDLKNINYISVDGQYCNMYTDEQPFLLHTSLTQLIKEFPETQFIRANRNLIVNTDKIKIVYPDDNLIVLTNGEKVSLSRRYKAAFFKNYRIFK
ncbi:response regulator transcription factor [Kordia sp. YSTF-M3]|uniref:Response regulator transcription factor n=1 Tax=Kordia aestuariivivens TaxID=2759037 RepID=A0ABR7Q9Y6_9FLAO|nr:response regulator transcription factor [Kordia aestuariivivens]MBC8755228.1 response regulator transcription factor [Kordia aestuariivivens]